MRILGKTVESSVGRVDGKIRQLVGLIDSHCEVTKELLEAHEDIREMLSEQVECAWQLYAKLDLVAQVLGGPEDESIDDEEEEPAQEEGVGDA